jgi:hypothetical protein
MNDKKDRRALRFSVNKLWIVTASSIEEAERICKRFGFDPESLRPLIDEDVDCLVEANEYTAEDSE